VVPIDLESLRQSFNDDLDTKITALKENLSYEMDIKMTDFQKLMDGKMIELKTDLTVVRGK
jgi:hypothetical protein